MPTPSAVVGAQGKRRFQQIGRRVMANERRWCYSWFASKPTGAGTTKAGLQKDSKWMSGDSITVAFLAGDTKLRKRVREVAESWVASGMANLRLVFKEGSDGD